MEVYNTDIPYKIGHPNSGFNIAYEVRDCEFGQGLFAAQKIPTGTKVWSFRAGINVMQFDEASLTEKLSKLNHESARRFLQLTFG